MSVVFFDVTIPVCIWHKLGEVDGSFDEGWASENSSAFCPDTLHITSLYAVSRLDTTSFCQRRSDQNSVKEVVRIAGSKKSTCPRTNSQWPRVLTGNNVCFFLDDEFVEQDLHVVSSCLLNDSTIRPACPTSSVPSTFESFSHVVDGVVGILSFDC